MEITFNVDETKILELAKTTSLEDLPRSIYYEAKREAIERAANEIKSKLSEKPYYSNSKERLYGEVAVEVYKQIETQIKELITQKFSEKSIELIVNRHAEKVITEWLEKKIFERMERLKTDIMVVSSGELEAERQAEADAHRAEIEALEEGR